MDSGSATPESSVHTEDTTTEGTLSDYSSDSEDKDPTDTEDSTSSDKEPEVCQIHLLERLFIVILMY